MIPLISRLTALLVATTLVTTIAATQDPVDSRHPIQSPRQAWAELQAAESGSWQVDWNPATGTPESIFGRGLRASAIPVLTLEAARQVTAQFIDSHRALLGLGSSQAVESIAQQVGEVWVMVFDQQWRDLPVRGGRVDVRLRTSGHVSLFGAIALPIPADFDAVPRIEAEQARAIAFADRRLPVPAPGLLAGAQRETLVVWGDIDRATPTPVRLAWEVEVGDVDSVFVGRVFVDAMNGAVLQAVSDRHACGCVAGVHRHGGTSTAPKTRPSGIPDTANRSSDSAYASVSGLVQGWVNTSSAPGAALTLVPMPRMRIVVASGAGAGINYYSAADGTFTVLTDPSDPTPVLEFYLAGNRIADVITAQGVELFHRIPTTNNSTGNVVTFGSSGASEIDRAQTTVYWHVDDVSTWAASELGRARIALIDTCNATVNYPASCNAFYTANTMRFLSASATCVNSAYKSVIEHEWGHALDDVYGGISTRDGLSEGNADIVAMFRSSDPVIGEGFYLSGHSPTYLRSGLNTRRFPVAGTVHDMGEVWMGCAWDMRTRLMASLGSVAGRERAEMLVLGSIAGNGRRLRTAVLDVFVLDDSDPDLCNGTPNYTDLAAACIARDIPYPEAPCPTPGLALPFGAACPGTGSSIVGLSGNADATVVSSSSSLPTGGTVGIQFVPMRPLPITGASFLSRSLLAGPVTVFVSILGHDFAEEGPGDVIAGPLAMTVGMTDGWYSGTFAAPIPPLAPMSPYYLVIDAPPGSIAAPIAASGAPFSAYLAGSASGWSGPYAEAFAFRLASPPIAVPHFSTANVPVAGGTLVMQMHSLPALVPGVFWVGLSDVVWAGRPLPFDLGPFGAAGCAVLASWDLPLVMLSSSVGSMQATLGVPSDPGIIGLVLYLQGAIIDVPANAFGVTVTNAVRIRVGG